MTEQPQPQVSEVPLEAQQQPRRPGNLFLFVLTLLTVAVVTGAVLFWIDITRPTHEPQVSGARVDPWPPRMRQRDRRADYDKALAHMQQLADALLAYHDGPMGDNVRWPASLDQLQALGMVDKDFSFDGVLSGRPIVYQPMMPIGHDPERWVLCHDVLVGWHRQTNTGYATNGPIAAVVMLADGSVKLLEGAEMDSYGGLNLQVGVTK